MKSGIRLKPEAIPSFLGEVRLIKVVSELSFGHPKCHFWAYKDGHFCQKCPFLGTKKWHFGCPNESSETTLIIPTSPKNDKITFGFNCLPLLNRFQAFCLISFFPPCILHYEPKKIRIAFSRHFSDPTKKAKWSKMLRIPRIQPVPVMGSNFNQNDSR